mgnify:CR=1 FL=1
MATAFKGNTSIIAFTEFKHFIGLTEIPSNAFYGCTNLWKIELPSITSIGENAFYACKSIAYMNFPQSVEIIGASAFEGCSSLTSIIVPKNINDIGYLAFYGCKNLVSLQVENGNTTYDSRDNCNAIIETATNSLVVGCSNTTFPSSVTHISDLAFAGNSSLTDITIPNTITSMGGGVFYSCSSLKNVVLSDNITSLSECMISHKSFTSTYSYNFGFFENLQNKNMWYNIVGFIRGGIMKQRTTEMLFGILVVLLSFLLYLKREAISIYYSIFNPNNTLASRLNSLQIAFKFSNLMLEVWLFIILLKF